MIKDIDYQEIEDNYVHLSSSSHRSEFAQFFTPIHIAKLMMYWVESGGASRILDPAFGLGAFYNALSHRNIEYVGYEKDVKIAQYIRSVLCERGEVVECHNSRNPLSSGKFKHLDNQDKKVQEDQLKLILKIGDYLDSDNQECFDGIIANPPYLKFHDYNNKRYVSKINEKFELSLSHRSNLYVLFLIQSLSQLVVGGRLAYIVPAEFLNSDYGVAVKQYLIKTGMLRNIIIFNTKLGVFDSAITTSCILLCANDEANHQKCHFSIVNEISDLEKIEEFADDYNAKQSKNEWKNPLTHFVYHQLELDPSVKWNHYFSQVESLKYHNLVPFSHYAKVTRGIATGANQYFTLSEKEVKAFHLPDDVLVQCVCGAKDVKGEFLTLSQFEQIKQENKKIYLFDATKEKERSLPVEYYLQSGEHNHIHKRYLTSKRTPWYKLESREVAPILVGVFNRAGIKFVRNEAGLLNLTCFHSVYPKYKNIDLLFAYLISDVAKEILMKNQRVYGGGLSKFEPNDLNNGLMLDIDCLPDIEKEKIVELFQQYRKVSLSGESNSKQVSDKILFQINEIFKNNFEIKGNWGSQQLKITNLAD